MQTKLLYLEDFTGLTCEATIIDLLRENGKDVLILDATIFYPQGGGQPYDSGFITSSAGKFAVEEVRFLDGIVRHIGTFANGAFQIGEVVQCAVDKDRRRLHTAGHLVDFAVSELKLPWTPGKGYHFPQGPYVEYGGILGDTDKEKLKQNMEEIANKAIQEDGDVSVRLMRKNEMASVCRFVPDTIPAGKPGRVVIFKDFGVPCGGTHVPHIGEIRGLAIRKIKQEGPNIRVGYDVSPDQ